VHGVGLGLPVLNRNVGTRATAPAERLHEMALLFGDVAGISFVAQFPHDRLDHARRPPVIQRDAVEAESDRVAVRGRGGPPSATVCEQLAGHAQTRRSADRLVSVRHPGWSRSRPPL